jgi:UDP-N-acetylmuramoyl-tripeptide--D-alanyl-D-alanine ligase
MLELEPESAALHRKPAEAIDRNGVDLVFAAGGLMRHLVDALPGSRVGSHAAKAAELVDAVVRAVGPGDAIMIKGSNSIRMALIVAALKERFGPGAGRQALKG